MEEICGCSSISFVVSPEDLSPPQSEDFIPGKPKIQFGEMEIVVVDSPCAMPARKITTPKRKRPEKRRHIPGFAITLSPIAEEEILEKTDADMLEEICGSSSISFLVNPYTMSPPEPEVYHPGKPRLQFGELEIVVVDSPCVMPPRRMRKDSRRHRKRPEKMRHLPGFNITLYTIPEEEEEDQRLEKDGGCSTSTNGEIIEDVKAAGDAKTSCETRRDKSVVHPTSHHSFADLSCRNLQKDPVQKKASCVGGFAVF